MVNLKQLLLKIIQSLPVYETGTPSITKTSGNSTVTGSSYVKFGHFVNLYITIKTTDVIDSGSNVFVGTFNNFYSPVTNAVGWTAGGKASVAMNLSGQNITIRNASTVSLAKDGEWTISVSYLIE